MSRGATILTGALLVALFLSGSARADQADPRLDELFLALKETLDVSTLKHIEASIWSIWLRSDREDVTALVSEGEIAVGKGQLRHAVRVFDNVVAAAPGFAEGWNRRATLHYFLGDYDASLADIDRTLALEPRHFGALDGKARILQRRGDYAGAIAAWRAFLAIHPNAPDIPGHIEYLRGMLP